MMRRWFLLGLLVSPFVIAAGPPEGALSAGEKGRAIAIEADERNTGFGDTVTELTMVLVNAAGRERTRQLTWKTLEADEPGEGDKSLTIFLMPRDIAGTAFLSHTHVDREDDQWLFLPALKRVKRIASANQSGAFMGSEFAYEDLLSTETEKFDHEWLRDEPCGEWQCAVVERQPRYASSGYTRQVTWIDRAELRPVRTEFYDRRDRLLKTLWFQGYRRYLDRYWRAHRMRMENHRTGKTTILEFSPFEFQSGLDARDFDPGALRRLR